MQSKLPNTSTNIFSFMTGLANEHQAINLAQGFPDFDISPRLIELVNEAMFKGFNQYAPMPGLPMLRNEIAKKANKLYDCNISAETEITITPGATYAIYTALTSILQPLDEVIVLEPCYDSYIPNIICNNAVPICIPLLLPNFRPDWQRIKDAITSKTKAIIINSPHNPSGYAWTHDDMLQLEAITTNTNITIVSDEVYEHITFDEVQHESVLKYPNLFARSFVVFSFGKTFHATGWKIGYCIAPPHLSHEFRKIHQYLSFSVNAPMQYGLAKFLEDENNYLQISAFYEKKRNLFLQHFESLPFTMKEITKGSYFQLASYEKMSDLPDKDFAVWITKNYGVAVIPISAFYQNGKDDKLVRLCFCKKDETIIEAAKRLSAIPIS